MYIKIYPENPQDRLIQLTVSTLQKGGIVIYPTDSVYGMGCSIDNLASVPRMGKDKRVLYTVYTSVVSLL